MEVRKEVRPRMRRRKGRMGASGEVAEKEEECHRRDETKQRDHGTHIGDKRAVLSRVDSQMLQCICSTGKEHVHTGE